MERKIIISLFFLIVFWVGDVFAQIEKPNFSGTWSINLAKSDPDELTKEFLKENKNASIKMLITHQEPRLQITSLIETENPEIGVNLTLEFVTDERETALAEKGKGISNPKDRTAFSKTFWKDDKIFIELYEKDENASKDVLFGTIELSLSANGKVLTRRSKLAEKLDYRFGISDSVLVFNLLKK